MQRPESDVIELPAEMVALRSNGARSAELESQIAQLARALRELCDLLEAYAPAWYTERKHEKAMSALRLVESPNGTPGPRPTQTSTGNLAST
jgi:hypothetical protein